MNSSLLICIIFGGNITLPSSYRGWPLDGATQPSAAKCSQATPRVRPRAGEGQPRGLLNTELRLPRKSPRAGVRSECTDTICYSISRVNTQQIPAEEGQFHSLIWKMRLWCRPRKLPFWDVTQVTSEQLSAPHPAGKGGAVLSVNASQHTCQAPR